MTIYVKLLAGKFREWPIDSSLLCVQLRKWETGWRAGTFGDRSLWSSSSASSSIVNQFLNRPLSVLASFWDCIRRSNCGYLQHKNLGRPDHLLRKRLYPWILYFSVVLGWRYHQVTDCHELRSYLDQTPSRDCRNSLGHHMYLTNNNSGKGFYSRKRASQEKRSISVSNRYFLQLHGTDGPLCVIEHIHMIGIHHEDWLS